MEWLFKCISHQNNLQFQIDCLHSLDTVTRFKMVYEKLFSEDCVRDINVWNTHSLDGETTWTNKTILFQVDHTYNFEKELDSGNGVLLIKELNLNIFTVSSWTFLSHKSINVATIACTGCVASHDKMKCKARRIGRPTLFYSFGGKSKKGNGLLFIFLECPPL